MAYYCKRWHVAVASACSCCNKQVQNTAAGQLLARTGLGPCELSTTPCSASPVREDLQNYAFRASPDANPWRDSGLATLCAIVALNPKALRRW